MDATLLDLSIECFTFYKEIIECLIVQLLNTKSLERLKGFNRTLCLARQCSSQLKNIVIFLKLAKIINLKIDTQTVDRIVGDTETWVNSFKKIVTKKYKVYKRELVD